MRRTLIALRGLTNTSPVPLQKSRVKEAYLLFQHNITEKITVLRIHLILPLQRGKKRSKGGKEDCSTANDHAALCLQHHSNKLAEINTGCNSPRQDYSEHIHPQSIKSQKETINGPQFHISLSFYICTPILVSSNLQLPLLLHF